MKLNRKYNSIRNIIFGIIAKCVGILGPFLVRTCMIYVLGNEYVGLNSLFSSILSFLSLAELGVGSALVYSMYKPIAEDDTYAINALFSLYRKLYRIIGTIIFAIGILLIPLLPVLVNKDLPSDINLYILYFIYLINSVLSYWLYGYKQSILMAYQRQDVISKIALIVQSVLYSAQIISIITLESYYAFVVWIPILTILNNLINKLLVEKIFPQYKCVGIVSKEVSKEIKKKVVALFGTKANSIVLHATDNIVITAFLGLNMVGKYGNYYYIMNSVCGFIQIIYTSITAGLGNSLQTESISKNYIDFNVLSFLNAWMIMFCSTCMLCLYQPFMEVWVRSESMLENNIVFLLVLYFYIYMIRRVILTYKDAAGLWWEDRYRPYVVMIVNLLLNIILCKCIGLYGIILSTVISMLVSVPWENYIVFKVLFKVAQKEYYFQMFKYTFISTLIISSTYLLCTFIPGGITGIVLRLMLCIFLSNTAWTITFSKNQLLKKSLHLLFKRRKGI